MPGAQERVLRKRIASTQNTKKITRAMELIAATRVVKAQQAANEARPYSENITSVISDLARSGAGADHPLLRAAENPSKVAVLVLSADRGLAGAYNTTVIRAAEREIMAARTDGLDYALVTVGRKAENYFRFRKYPIERAFGGFSERPGFLHAREIAETVAALFAGDCDIVTLVYTRFISMGSQRVSVRRFLPLDTGAGPVADPDGGPIAAFEFEPSASAVLTSLLPRYLESRIFAALLDAAASELSSRQRAMKSATDNAEELILKFTRKMNQARQDSITTEIMEIIGGAEALSADTSNPDELHLSKLESDLFGRTPTTHYPAAHSEG